MKDYKKNTILIDDFKLTKYIASLYCDIQSLIDIGEYDEALKGAEFLYKQRPKWELFIYIYAKLLYLCGYEKKAIPLFEKIINYNKIKIFTQNQVLYYLSSCYCWTNKNIFRALNYINKVIKENDSKNISNYESYIVKGRILYSIDKYELALKYLNMAYNIHKEEIIEIYLSKAYFKINNYLKGFQYLQKLTNQDKKVNGDITKLNFNEIQCYLDCKINNYTKLSKIKINKKIKKTLDNKLYSNNITYFDLKNADFLVHYQNFAVAIKYDRTIASAPFIVYKSKNISISKKKAKNLNVPIFQDNIALTLFKRISIYSIISYSLFEPIAKLLAETYNNKKISTIKY